MIIVIDNYDSFTYNLVQYTGMIDNSVCVYKNDQITIKEIKKLNPSHIIISPGPGRPEDSGISVKIIEELKSDFAILGICLGHQAIGYAFNANITNANDIFHGKTSKILHNGDGIFDNIPSPFIATRYHSLIIEKSSIPDSIDTIAKTANGVVMGIKHKQFCLYGLQFHPESILTDYGVQIIRNFINENNR